MIRRDLATARAGWIDEATDADERAEREQSTFQAYRDGAGRVADFHSLRHSFVSNLAAGGVHPKLAQQLARHSTITLTMDRYTHTAVGDLADALTSLPSTEPVAPQPQVALATGTDDAAPHAAHLQRAGNFWGPAVARTGGAVGAMPEGIGAHPAGMDARNTLQERGLVAACPGVTVVNGEGGIPQAPVPGIA